MHVSVTLSTQHLIVLDAAKKLQPSSPLEIRFMSYLYAKCVGQENVIHVWLFFMLMQRSQRETLFLLRVDEGSTILSVSPRSLLVESSNLNWVLDGMVAIQRCVCAHADKPKRWEAVRCKSDHQLVVYAPTCALRSSSVAPRVSYTHIRPPFGIWQSRRQGLMNLRCKPICCTVR